MKTKITLSIIIVLFSAIVNAQWVAVGSGMDNYVMGSVVYNGNLYASGNFEHADGNQCLGIAKWDGTSWSAVGGGFQYNALTNVVNAMIVFNNQLIAGGYLDSAGGIPIHNVASWNGTNWSPLGTNLPIGTVNCFAIHNGELYAGGSGSGAGNHGVAKWNGSTWTALDPGSGSNINVLSLASYNGELYAAGNFISIDGVSANHIARWNGTTWSDVSGGVTGGFINIARALAVFNNKLYVGGNFLMAGSVGVNHVASWDGSNWADVGGGVGGSTAIVQSFLSAGNKLFVGGTYWQVNSVTANRAAYWDGISWTVLGTDLAAGSRTQAVYNGTLYSFGELAGSGQNFAGKWSGGTFTSIRETNSNERFSLYPNPAFARLNVSIKNTNEKIQYCIMDIAGRKVMNIPVHDGSTNTFSVDVSSLEAGTYLLSEENSITSAKMFVIQH